MYSVSDVAVVLDSGIRIPVQPSDFDPALFVQRIVRRAWSSHDGESRIVGSVPAFYANLHENRNAITKRMAQSLASLKKLIPLSPQDAVKSWATPDISKITGPDVLPSMLGSIHVVAGNVSHSRMIIALILIVRLVMISNLQ